MAYYHVLIKTKDTPANIRCLSSDLTRHEFKKKFIKPYNLGRCILTKTDTFNTKAIVSIRIVETELESEIELAQIRRRSQKEMADWNSQPDAPTLICLGRGYEPEDIEEAGKDVKDKFIHTPPGEGTHAQALRLAHNPWIVTIGSGIVIALVTLAVTQLT